LTGLPAVFSSGGGGVFSRNGRQKLGSDA